MAPVSELKLCLKDLGMSQAGDKGTLEYRIKKGKESVEFELKTPDGDPVQTLKLGKLKKHAAKVGISPIGTLDEIMFSYIDFLKKTKRSNNASSTDHKQEGSKDKKLDTSKNAVKQELSEKVLKLSEEDDFIGILNLAGANLTSSSSVALLRKSYLKLSLLLHPDKNTNIPASDATKVFQALVNAYERISQPELLVEEEEGFKGTSKGKKKKKVATISRSNVGCKRTRVCCPRCKNPWSESSVEGNPEYYYNFMMTGIKSFTCATCLFEFGCMTALHYCPFCKHSSEYHPSDYHRKITCGNKACNRDYGFYLYHCSDRVIKDMKIEVKRHREKQAKTTEQKRRRAEAFRRRQRGQNICSPATTNNDTEDAAEIAFRIGLSNECPRCGKSLADFESDESEIDHLRNCNGSEEIARNKRKKDTKEREQNEKRRRQDLQEDVTAKAAWDFLGGSNENMWMLTDGALQKECKEQGLNTKGKETHEMIAALASTRKKNQQAIEKFTSQGSAKTMTTDSLPSNLHSMTVSQLKAVAAAHGIKVNSKMRKCDIIELLESSEENDNNNMLMITTGDSAAPKKSSTKKQVIESDSESNYETDGSASDY